MRVLSVEKQIDYEPLGLLTLASRLHYCFNHDLTGTCREKGKRLRQMSAKVIEEVQWVHQRYPMQFVVLLDDLFIVYENWLRELAERFPREVGLPFFAMCAPIASPRQRLPCSERQGV